jgi:hypothetical protein
MTEIAPIERYSSKSLAGALLVLGIGLLTAVASESLGLSGSVSGVVVSGSVLVPAGIAWEVANRHRSATADIVALSHGILNRPAPLVIVIVAFAILFVDSLLAAMVGYVAGASIFISGGSSEQLLPAVAAGSFVIVPFVFLATYFIARRSAHYLGSHPIRCLIIAVLVYTAGRMLLVGTMAVPGLELTLELALTLAAYSALLLIICVAGAFVARRQHLVYIASRLYRRLSPGDQVAVLALMREAAVTSDSA